MMWKEVTRAFFIVTVVLAAASLGIRNGSYLVNDVAGWLWLAAIGVLSLWMIAAIGRLIVRRYAKPRQPDGPETDYHDFPG